MSALRSGWATKVVATVPGDIGGSGLSTGLIRRGTQFLVGEAFDRLIDLFEDIWAGWQDWLDARKLKYMRARLRTGVDVGSVTVRGKKYNSAELVGLGVGGNEDGWGHANLFVIVDAALLLTVVPVEEGMLEGSIVMLPMRVELMELIGRPRV